MVGVWSGYMVGRGYGRGTWSGYAMCGRGTREQRGRDVVAKSSVQGCVRTCRRLVTHPTVQAVLLETIEKIFELAAPPMNDRPGGLKNRAKPATTPLGIAASVVLGHRLHHVCHMWHMRTITQFEA